MPAKDTNLKKQLPAAIGAMSSGGAVYNLHTLGWVSFQNLCGTILREIMGQTYEVFSDTADAGRDGAFWGKWQTAKGEDLSGSFVVQCKFFSKQGANLNTSHVNNEIEKTRKLARKGLAQNYILMTNASLSSPTEMELRERFLAIRGVKRFRAFGGNWITQQIRENRHLRTLVPRVYGLGDLTEILDERVYAQAQEILYWFGDELDKFVVTDSHQRSVQALTEKGFVFLLGDPGSGKSTIAAALALAAADNWNSRVVKVEHPQKFKDHWNPKNPEQFYWVDDAFGQTQYSRERAVEWNYALQPLNAAIKQGARAIFTSRTYIYKAAIDDLKEDAFPLLRESRVVIEVEKLTRREREQILYNHLRLGKQPATFRRALKPFLSEFASHENFLPETARRLGYPLLTKKVKPNLQSVINFVAQPEDYIREVILRLGDEGKAALGLIFQAGGKLNAPLDLEKDEIHALELMNASIGAVRKALSVLDGSLVVQEMEAGEKVIRFKHPTIRDAFGSVISGDSNLMDVYLNGVRTESLINEVTCGEVGLRGVELIVPQSRFPIIIKRLQALLDEPGGIEQVIAFLASRCSIEFLREFLKSEPIFTASIHLKEDFYLIYSDEVELFSILREHNLLPESDRQRFIKFAHRTALATPEWRFMNDPKIRSLFRHKELHSLRAKVRRSLTAARLQGLTNIWKAEWEESGDEAPENYFLPWEQEIRAFSYEFRGNQAVRTRFVTALRKLSKLKEQLKKDLKKKEGSLEAASESENVATERSLFDDVDS